LESRTRGGGGGGGGGCGGLEDGRGRVDDVVLHEALDAPAGVADLAIEAAVAAGGGARGVDRSAVDLDRETQFRPGDVDLVPAAGRDLDRVLEHGARQAGVEAEPQEAALERALGDRRVEPLGTEAAPEVAHAARARDPREDIGDRLDVERLQQLGLLDRALELVELQHRAEIHEGAGDRGARNAVEGPPVLGSVDLRAVEPDPLAIPLAAARHHHVDLARAPREEPEMTGRRAMREHRALATGEDGRHGGAAAWEGPMADGVDTFVHAVQPTCREPQLDLIIGRAERTHLSIADDPALLRRERRHTSRDD
jgi:hypothetical protein